MYLGNTSTETESISMRTQEQIVEFIHAHCKTRPGDRTNAIGGVLVVDLKSEMKKAGTSWGKVMNLAFGEKKKLNALNYKFGCSEPLTHLPEISQLMVRLRCYRNSLAIESMQTSREFVEAYRKDHQYASILDEISSLYDMKTSIEASINDERVVRRDKNDDQEMKQNLADVQKKIHVAMKKRKDRASEFKSEEWFVNASDTIKAASAQRLQLIHDEFKGVDAYTRTNIKKSKPEKLNEWDGSGIICRQIQRGVSLSSQFKLTVITDAEREMYRGRIPRGSTHMALLNVANIGAVQFGVNIHRSMPDSMRPVQVVIVRSATGRFVRHQESIAARQYRWHIMVTVEDCDGFQQQKISELRKSAAGSVAIDIGWRRTDDRRLKVITWAGDDGRSGWIAIPDKIENEILRAEQHNSHRTIEANDIQKRIAAFVEESFGELPDQVRQCLKRKKSDVVSKSEAVRDVLSMKSDRRIKYLALCIERHCGGHSICDDISKWILIDGQCQAATPIRKSTTRHRKQFFQSVVRAFLKDYKTIVVESLNLSDIGKKASLAQEDNSAVRANKTIASVGQFLEKIRPFALEVSARNSSRSCSYCGDIQNIGSAAVHTCTACGTTYDRDENACRNLLARAQVVHQVELAKDWEKCEKTRGETELSQLSSQSEWQKVF